MARAPALDAADPLARVLHGVRVSGTFYCHSELTAPWGLTMPAMPGCLWFHCVTEGRAELDLRGAPHSLERGTFALVPHGRGHAIRSGPRVAAPNVLDLPHLEETERYAMLKHGGGGARTTLLCGVVRLDATVGAALESVLPPMLRVDGRETSTAGWFDTLLSMMAAESRRLRPGGEAIVTRLADVLVVQCLRSWLDADPNARKGWLGALRMPRVGSALAAMWKEPSRPWTVAGLAKVAAMSRSAFAAHFEEVVGEPPMRYLGRVRMQLAADALATHQASVGEVADRTGYQSEAAFSRAFKRFTGTSPGAVRRQARTPSR